MENVVCQERKAQQWQTHVTDGVIKSWWDPPDAASQKRKRGCLFFLKAPYPCCCCCWAGEGWMLFLQLALPEVIWNRRLFPSPHPWRTRISLPHFWKRLPVQSGITMEMWAWSWSHLSGSQAPWPMVASLLSCQEAQKACKLLRKPSKPAGEAGSLGSCLASVRANVLLRNLSITV